MKVEWLLMLQENVYYSGGFEDTVDFDPGAGVANLITMQEYNQEIFVSKLDPSGNFVWAKKMGGMDSTGNFYASSQAIGLDPSGKYLSNRNF